MTREHILLFENEKGLKRIITLLLRQAKMRVTTSYNADTALDIIHSASREGNEISVVIIDVSSPDPEGEKLLRHLQGKRGNPPTIVINQYGNENTITGESSNLSLLPAPFEPDDLIESIKEATFRKDTRKIANQPHN